jgi:hypothetical protein
MRTHRSINLIIRGLNVNYIHDRMKQIDIIVYKFLFLFFSPKAENS